VTDAFNRAILDEVAHRPWRMPDRPWVMTQTWHDLLFAHWPVDSQELRSKVPPAFELDLLDGHAWVGIVPFHMTNVAPRWVPSLPWISAFPELNVRTYIRVADRPGIYFFSLDAGSSLAVHAARALLNLPYYSASMTVTPQRNGIDYESHRDGADGTAEFRATYTPTGPAYTADPGSLEYFLTERYCLYHIDHRGVPYRLEIHHPPWALQPADGNFVRNSMTDAIGLALPNRAPLMHFAKRQDMVAWAPTSLPPER
jgi:uncharacterized protein YqjF (DUF2071 family)